MVIQWICLDVVWFIRPFRNAVSTHSTQLKAATVKTASLSEVYNSLAYPLLEPSEGSDENDNGEIMRRVQLSRKSGRLDLSNLGVK